MKNPMADIVDGFQLLKQALELAEFPDDSDESAFADYWHSRVEAALHEARTKGFYKSDTAVAT